MLQLPFLLTMEQILLYILQNKQFASKSAFYDYNAIHFCYLRSMLPWLNVVLKTWVCNCRVFELNNWIIFEHFVKKKFQFPIFISQYQLHKAYTNTVRNTTSFIPTTAQAIVDDPTNFVMHTRKKTLNYHSMLCTE